jgi:hypothetical protein
LPRRWPELSPKEATLRKADKILEEFFTQAGQELGTA